MGGQSPARWWRHTTLPKGHPLVRYYPPWWLELALLAALVFYALDTGNWFKAIFIGGAITIIHCLAWLWEFLRRSSRLPLRGLSFLIGVLLALAFLIGLLWLAVVFTMREMRVALWQAVLIQLVCQGSAVLVGFAGSCLWLWLQEKRERRQN
jgi:hypothetical protein